MTEAEIEHFVHEPPDDTRAWTRAMLLRRAGAESVDEVDWDAMWFRRAGDGHWPVLRGLRLDDPLGFTRAAVEPILRAALTLDQALDALRAPRPLHANDETEVPR